MQSVTRPSWFRRHPRRTAVLAGITVLGIGAAIFFAWPDKKPPLSTNPVVAGYQKQLPDLADKAQSNPKDAQAAQDYAIALYATGDIQGAKVQYEKAISLNPDDATLRNNIGNVYRDLGDNSAAVAAYQKAIDLKPKDVHAYTNLANMYLYKLNQKTKAIEVYQQALQQFPSDQELQVLLGLAYEQNGDKANAQKAYQTALALNANNTAAQAGLKRVQ